jgi:hypothetical protein
MSAIIKEIFISLRYIVVRGGRNSGRIGQGGLYSEPNAF